MGDDESLEEFEERTGPRLAELQEQKREMNPVIASELGDLNLGRACHKIGGMSLRARRRDLGGQEQFPERRGVAGT